MGTYYHLSDSYHAYEEVYNKVLDVLKQKDSGDVLWYDSYLGWNQGMHYTPEPMFTAPEHIDRDVKKSMILSSLIFCVKIWSKAFSDSLNSRSDKFLIDFI